VHFHRKPFTLDKINIAKSWNFISTGYLLVIQNDVLECIFIRGAAKFVGVQKSKRPKRTLTSVRYSLTALSRIQISWFEAPLQLVYDTLEDAVDKVDPSILLSHKILWQKVKRLLKCHLQQKYRLLIELRPKTIQYQLSLMRTHITYFHTTPDELTLLLTPLAYDACWVCNR